MSNLFQTLGNEQWILENEDRLRAAMPEDWTPEDSACAVQIGYRLKLAGVNWTSREEFGKVMYFLITIGVLLRRDGNEIKLNPERLPRLSQRD